MYVLTKDLLPLLIMAPGRLDSRPFFNPEEPIMMTGSHRLSLNDGFEAIIKDRFSTCSEGCKLHSGFCFGDSIPNRAQSCSGCAVPARIPGRKLLSSILAN